MKLYHQILLLLFLFQSSSQNKIIVASGLDKSGRSNLPSEIIDLDDPLTENKFLPAYPFALHGAASIFLNEMLIICGGVGNHSNECYSLQNDEFTFAQNLAEPRIYSGNFEIEGLLISGGYPLGSIASKTLEHFGDILQDNLEIPEPTRAHCMAYGNKIEAHSIWIIGGHTGQSEEESYVTAQTYYYYVHDGQWYPGSNLNFAREFHACSSIHFGNQYGEALIVVAGGRDEDGNALDTVEFLLEDDGSWFSGPKLPKPLFGHSMITLADNRVIVIGGQDGKEASQDIFELVCDFSSFGVDCEWITLEQKLAYPRFGMTVVKTY